MSERLYLIRRNLESYLGPLTLREMRAAYKRMEFGVQDEVASGFREWIAFDDIEKLKRIYPELIDLVRKEMLLGWGIAAEDEDTRQLRPRSPTKKSGQGPFSSFLRGMVMVLILAGAAFLAFAFARNGEFASKFLSPRDPSVERALDMVQSGDIVRFEAYMDRYQKDIIAAMGARKNLEAWLPLVRIVAFRRDGRWEGLSSRYLRGNDRDNEAPKDCSRASWQNRWRKDVGQWAAFVEGQALPKTEWAKVLLWDPFWIKRRTPMAGWHDPGSYYEACLTMARRALQDVVSSLPADTKPPQADVLEARLTWQLKVVRGESIGDEVSMSGSLWALSCFESTEKSDALDECVSAITFGKDWEPLVRFRRDAMQVRIVLSQATILGATELDMLRKIMTSFKARDPFTRFNYEAEARFYQQVLANQGRVTEAVGQMRGSGGGGINFAE